MDIDVNQFPVLDYTEKNLVNFTSKVQFEYLLNGEIDFDNHMLFLNNLDKDGYGRFWFKTHSIPAHRFSFMVEYGEVPDYYVVRHKNSCHIRNCVNPKHLKVGTQRDNIHDMIKLGTLITGEESNLSTHQNLEIRNLIYDIYNDQFNNYKEAIEKYNMTQANLSGIILGKTWSKLVDPLLKELGINRKQLRDKILKGHAKGDDNCNAKLNWEIVRQIRYECESPKCRNYKYYDLLANHYNVSRSAITAVVYKKLWNE